MKPVKQRLLDEGMREHALTIQERVKLLEKSRLFSGLTNQQLQSIAPLFDLYQAPARSYVCREGDQSDFICLVCSGRVAVSKNDHNNLPKIIATVGPGQTVGEMSVIDGGRRSASLVVQMPSLLLVLNSENFGRMEEDAPRLWGRIMLQLAGILSKRLRQTSGVLAEYLPD
ncbi:MAG TPA: cyclic nucleotide-binding domain-containing protein [Deltaproteobacteria bacterium]|nr:cyclic nucleotide-binding domain-containing protein [Deltaproteobacteria bacterium]HQB39238.1 cyclic nucleotide-binding domain-containing protein [Deltaproteobacteria bacterium]